MFEGKALFQMKFYALVLWRTTGVVPRLLQLMYLGDREVLRYSPDEADLRATERKLLALWDAVERATALRDFPARPSKLCDWCDHQALCPSFGGTPPPFPDVVPGPETRFRTSAQRCWRRRRPTRPLTARGTVDDGWKHSWAGADQDVAHGLAGCCRASPGGPVPEPCPRSSRVGSGALPDAGPILARPQSPHDQHDICRPPAGHLSAGHCRLPEHSCESGDDRRLLGDCCAQPA
jgi:hypothetical protein